MLELPNPDFSNISVEDLYILKKWYEKILVEIDQLMIKQSVLAKR